MAKWVGTPTSIAVHTVLFAAIFFLEFIGVSFENILLILTTLVSFEAIYLAIFIQLSVNRSFQSLEEVEGDIDRIQDEVKDLGQDVDEISDDIDKIQESDQKDDMQDEAMNMKLESIQSGLHKLLSEVELLKSI